MVKAKGRPTAELDESRASEEREERTDPTRTRKRRGKLVGPGGKITYSTSQRAVTSSQTVGVPKKNGRCPERKNRDGKTGPPASSGKK